MNRAEATTLIEAILARRGSYSSSGKGADWHAAKALTESNPDLEITITDHPPTGGQPIVKHGKLVSWGGTAPGFTTWTICPKKK